MSDNKIRGFPDDGQRAIMQAMQDYFYGMYAINPGMLSLSNELRELSDEDFLQFCGQMIAHISDAYQKRMDTDERYELMEDTARLLMRHAQGKEATIATRRERELEDLLWWTLFDIQDFFVSQHTGNTADVMDRLKERVMHFRNHHDWYFQHPSWQEPGDEPMTVTMPPTLPDAEDD
ncbi:MAG: hypothetical protein ACPG7F_00250 [Aggregatilineales bacterium]